MGETTGDGNAEHRDSLAVACLHGNYRTNNPKITPGVLSRSPGLRCPSASQPR
jgi:hypothetical protein